VKKGYASSYPYTHFSVLATIEANWNLAPLTSNDRDAAHMGEFFLGQPSRGLNEPPPHPIPARYVIVISGTGGIGVLVASAPGETRSRPHANSTKAAFEDRSICLIPTCGNPVGTRRTVR
jgi:hypothetical protein